MRAHTTEVWFVIVLNIMLALLIISKVAGPLGLNSMAHMSVMLATNAIFFVLHLLWGVYCMYMNAEFTRYFQDQNKWYPRKRIYFVISLMIINPSQVAICESLWILMSRYNPCQPWVHYLLMVSEVLRLPAVFIHGQTLIVLFKFLCDTGHDEQQTED